MAVRTSTPITRLGDAVFAALKGISQRKNAAYLTTPATVKRQRAVGDLAATPKPILALSSFSWEAEPSGASRFDGKIVFAVHCIVEDVGDSEAALLRLVSDVIYAMAKDVTLGSQAIYIFPRSFEPNLDLTNRSGLAVTTVLFDCLYRFDVDNP